MASTPRICGSATNSWRNSSLLRMSVAIEVEQLEDLVGVGGEVDADVDGGHGVADAEIGDGGDLRVGNDVEGAVGVADGGFAQGHGFDDAGKAGEAHGVADVELVFDDDEDAVEHVLDDVLSGEADGDSGDAGGGQQGAEVDADGVENLHAGDEADDGEAGGADDAGEGLDLGDAAGADGVLLGDAGHARGDGAQ